jgi:hypothetical protein
MPKWSLKKMKSKRPGQIGNDKDANWSGAMARPRYFTKYTLPGLLILMGWFVCRVAEFLLFFFAIINAAQFVCEALGLLPIVHPLTAFDLAVIAAGALWGGFRLYRQYVARQRKKTPFFR